MSYEVSPTSRALLALEVIQNSPGVTANRLGERLGVTERAARRYVAILRDAGVPIDSVSGPYGGYRMGRGLRLAPLMFTAAEAMGLVMAVLEGHRDAADPTELVGGALAKILRVLPEPVAGPVLSLRHVPASRPGEDTRVNPELTNELIEACTTARRVRLTYEVGRPETVVIDMEPWAVVLRHSRWYLLGWSTSRQAQRALRVDRIVAVAVSEDSFTPPAELDALRTLEEHFSQGWTHAVDVLVDASPRQTARWLPRSLGRLESLADGRTRLTATTDEPDWYARQLARIEVPYSVLGSAEIQQATAALGQRLLRAAQPAAEAASRTAD
ncbi:MAG TPA: WYL domain-containing protein [Acidimicrobiales bacterium]|jgi:predicted DNA-binding transcriptional regulator YafY|nr:WYL domain-containing protein [Acidimicrobiales bacterium]